jgi:uncharacterized protein YndB with AHSA1/START domain
LRQYSLVTQWHLEAPIERIREALVAPEEWPRWWRYVEAVVELEKGDAQGIGALRRYTWSSRLPLPSGRNTCTVIYGVDPK